MGGNDKETDLGATRKKKKKNPPWPSNKETKTRSPASPIITLQPTMTLFPSS